MRSSTNLLKPATGEPIINADKDMVIGCYFASTLTPGAKGEGMAFGSEQEDVLAHDFGVVDLQAAIKVRMASTRLRDSSPPDVSEGALISDKDSSIISSGKSHELVETSVGRILFNRALPSDFPFINQQLKKRDIADIIIRVIKRYGTAGTPHVLDSIKNFGFAFATRSGISWGMDDLHIPEEKPAIVEYAEKEVIVIFDHYQRGLLTERERYDRVVEVWQGAVDKITKLVPQALDPKGSVFTMVNSGARGSWTQIRQM
jgi:DNA-directed RNA polymerase subunit beta'